MKGFLILCVVALLVTVSAKEVVTFDYACTSNGKCMEPGAFYCALGGTVESVQCIDNVQCKITCADVTPKEVDEKWMYAKVTIEPVDKRVGIPVVITVVDNREGMGIVYDVEVYKGGGFESEYVEGATNIGESTAIADTFTISDYANGKLFVAGSTGLSGVASFTPDEPGQYAIRTADNYFVFVVGTSGGNKFVCDDGVCDESLGEDEYACPQDCGDSEFTITTVCGDGNCDYNETKLNCPEDCELNSGGTVPVEPVEPATTCGNGICDEFEKVSCPQDCPVTPAATDPATPPAAVPTEPAASGGIDMTIIIIVVVVILIGLGAFLVMSGKVKLPKSSAKPATAKPVALAQAAAPAQPAPQANVCTKCGAKLTPADKFCMGCGNKV